MMLKTKRLRPAHRRLYRHRRVATHVIYALVIAVAYAAAFLTRFEFEWPAQHTGTFLATVPLLVVVRLLTVHYLRLSRERWRYVSTPDIIRLALAMVLGTALFFPLAYFLPLEPVVPRSVLLLEWVFSTHILVGLRLAYRVRHELTRHSRDGAAVERRRVLVVGAGEAGQMLVREMQRLPGSYLPVGFVDDDPLKWGATVHRLEVIGATADLSKIAAHLGAEELIIAMPSADPKTLRRVVAGCEETGLPFKILPGIAEVLAGHASPDLLRDVRLEDLLGREPVALEMPELANDLAGKAVLITGAAGSIGSELARQVALHEPARLLLLDQAETPLFFLELELRERYPDAEIVPIIADIVHGPCLEGLFEEHRPHRVFHAAAYKHVPMMEANARQAVRNNVIGTWRVADAAGRHGADRFVLISTDKAVRPSSVMGASKRLAERVVLELQERHPDTAYGAVRFGNVLGSSGSVIPIFKQQLEEGKPLTVTHPDVTRYFMTIPEAVQLVLQASLLPDLRGHIAMLEMGEPVPIVELARNLLRLSGRGNVNGSSIRFTGLRPGEKMHEELVAPEEGSRSTAVPKVSIVASGEREAVRSILSLIPAWRRELEAGREQEILAFLAETFPSLRLDGPADHRALKPRPREEEPAARGV